MFWVYCAIVYLFLFEPMYFSDQSPFISLNSYRKTNQSETRHLQCLISIMAYPALGVTGGCCDWTNLNVHPQGDPCRPRENMQTIDRPDLGSKPRIIFSCRDRGNDCSTMMSFSCYILLWISWQALITSHCLRVPLNSFRTPHWCCSNIAWI